MSPADHNKTLVMLHAAIGAFYTFGLIASPWIIAQNFSRPEKVPEAVVIFSIVFLMALLFWSVAIAMHRRKRRARILGLFAAVAAMPIFWPVGVYTWWFLHSKGGKEIYEQN